MANKIKITQIKSIIGQKWNQKLTIKALGLHRIRHAVVHNDTKQIRGMINKVSHLVKVEEAE